MQLTALVSGKRKREGREGDRDGEGEDAVAKFNKLTQEKSAYGDGKKGRYGDEGDMQIKLTSPEGARKSGKDRGLLNKVFSRTRGRR